MKAQIPIVLIILLVGSYMIWQNYQLKNQMKNLPQSFAQQGITAISPPKNEPLDLVNLGKMLFFDKILSGRKDISCATCHHTKFNSGDGLPLAIGAGGKGLGPTRTAHHSQIVARNSQALFNLTNVPVFFWDGRIQLDKKNKTLTSPEQKLFGKLPYYRKIIETLDSSLAAQTLFPIASSVEMMGIPGTSELASLQTRRAVWDKLLARLFSNDEYKKLFLTAFPKITSIQEFNIAHMGNALAAFIRQSFQATNTPLDLFLRGNYEVLDEKSKKGAVIFLTKGRCVKCHNGPLLSDFSFQAKAFPQFGPGKKSPGQSIGGVHHRKLVRQSLDDFGRYFISYEKIDLYRFRVPPLRNVAHTGPWGHNGAFASLELLIEHLRDPKMSLENFSKKNVKNSLFHKNLIHNKRYSKQRLAAFEQSFGDPLKLSDQEAENLVYFLKFALTDLNSLKLSKLVPARVPSGLEVER